MIESGRPIKSLTALAGGSAAIVVDVLYLAAIAQQGVTPPGGRVVFVALWIGVAGLVAVLGAFVRRSPARAAMLGISAGMLIALAVPAVFSVGIPLMLCGGMVGLGAMRAAELAQVSRWLGFGGPLLVLLLAGIGVAIGFAVTGF